MCVLVYRGLGPITFTDDDEMVGIDTGRRLQGTRISCKQFYGLVFKGDHRRLGFITGRRNLCGSSVDCVHVREIQ